MMEESYILLLPVLVVGIGGLVLLMVDAFSKVQEKGLALLASAIVLAGLLVNFGLWFSGYEFGPLEGVSNLVIFDRQGLFFNFVILLGTFLCLLFAGGYLREYGLERGEFYPLVLFASVGMMVMIQAIDFMVLFIGLETMSLPVYCLCGFSRTKPQSMEGALKYFLLGAFASALLLYGIALLYGITGHTDFVGISKVLKARVEEPVLAAGMFLVLAGFMFKIAAVPFHMWVPDAYEGAPTPVTTYMAIAVKTAAFAMMLRVLFGVFPILPLGSLEQSWPQVLIVLSVLTMTLGNLCALHQENIKRLLAYSSIAHVGYILIGVVAASLGNPHDTSSVLFYLLAYTVSNAGAFGAIIILSKQGGEYVDEFNGIGKKEPFIALVMTIFLLSLAGIPPTGGFFAKFYIFKKAIESELYLLCILGVLNTVVGVYYYLRITVSMYMKEKEPQVVGCERISSGYISFALLVALFFVLMMGLFPETYLEMAKAAIE
jgi:NADH-quinone oxidoreductase subunit N